jgi:1-acyl-sn-glycerol-3-phosphate acyltransferase
VLYGLIATLLLPAAWWGRLRVYGIERVPGRGGLLLVPNHDSQWDPVLVGIALRRRHRLRFLARAPPAAVGRRLPEAT